MSLFSVLFCVSGIMNGNETGILSDVLGASLDLCVTIVYRLNFYLGSPLIKFFFLVIIEVLIVFINGHEIWCFMPPLLLGRARLSLVVHLPQKDVCR